jgi:hypothetical protein
MTPIRLFASSLGVALHAMTLFFVSVLKAPLCALCHTLCAYASGLLVNSHFSLSRNKI